MSRVLDRTDLDKARDFLRGEGWLVHTPPAFRDALLAEGVLRSFGRGDVVMRHGDAPNGLWVVVEGGLSLEIAPYEQGPNFAHVLRPGFWFGVMEGLTGGGRLYSHVATRPSVCLHVPKRGVDKVLAVDPEGWRWIGQLCAGHLALAIGAMNDLMIRSSEARLAAILLRLAGARDVDNPREAMPEIDASHEDFGVMANLSRSAVGRILKEFEDKRLVACGYGAVRILDQAGLRAQIAR
jgi:CRP/FNR family transcriptional regulator, cyclic AMP receptor protein